MAGIGAFEVRMGSAGEYSETLLDHYRHPRNVGDVEGSAAVAQVGDPAHGDVLRFGMKIEGDQVIEARFRSFGCTAAIAAGSMATVMVTGKRLEEVERVSNQDVADALGGLPESKRHCSVLAEQAIREALRRWRAAGAGEAPCP
ncbi:MAG TPA: iron-sulfur cluster assembly scaffold protein [Candidatus Polarisedimenticolia bacterium]|nr:iron-sulfur cluster assembly scaffold protein [Candidatus Polarisedimenticolia bacterium]